MTESSPLQTCPNCDATLSGEWCHDCGQRQRHRRLDVKDLAADAFDSIVDVDGAIWRTLVDLTLRPGRAIGDFVEGKRRRYINPIKNTGTLFKAKGSN